MPRNKAREAQLVYYDNGIPCASNHHPIIRLTKTGGCFHCWKEGKEKRAAEASAKTAYQINYYLVFRKRDRSVEIIGPFKRRITAINNYKRRYLAEYGVPCPDDKFGPVETELEEKDDVS